MTLIKLLDQQLFCVGCMQQKVGQMQTM